MSDQGTLGLGHPDAWIIDTSSLIEIKRAVAPHNQWELLKTMEIMVRDGRLGAPRHVYREMGKTQHPDAPGVWASGVRGVQLLPLDVDPACTRSVLSEVPTLVDVNKIEEDADPYVVALAWQLMQEAKSVYVVTEDHVDRESTSIATACDSLGIVWVRLHDFVASLGVPIRRRHQ